jgi:hypothetical protein
MMKLVQVTIVVTALLGGWLLLASGPPSTAAQQPKKLPDPLWLEKLRPVLEAKPLEAAADDDAVRKLLKARYNAALRGLQARYEEVEAGKATLFTMLDAYSFVRNSWIELSDKPAEQIRAREIYFELAKEAESAAEVRHDRNALSTADLETYRYIRLDAEIDLVRAKKSELVRQIGAKGFLEDSAVDTFLDQITPEQRRRLQERLQAEKRRRP